MKQITIRGFGPELERLVRELADREGISLNQAVLRLLRKGAGLERPKAAENVVGSSLDDLIGTWSDEEAQEIMEAVQDFETIDESLWR